MRQQFRAARARAEQPHAEGIEITAIGHGQAVNWLDAVNAAIEDLKEKTP